MWLRTLHADRLRNLKTVAIELPPGLTLITGRNGQGKTSLLEAAYLVGTAHSFRTRRIDEIVGWEGGPLRAFGEASGRRGDVALGIVLDQGQRRLFVDGAERDLEGFLGRLDLVALSGEALRVLRDGPDGRRRFLDSGVAGLRPSFLRDLRDHRRALASRNALLRRAVGGPTTARREMEVWEERLAVVAERIHRQRREYAIGLASRLGAAERALFPDGGEVRLGYRPSPARAGDEEACSFAAAYREELERGRR